MRIERDLPCKLTAEEVAETAKALAENVAQYNTVEEEAKEVAAEYRDRLKLLDTMMRRLSNIVATEEEERPVMCEYDYHSPEHGQKRLIRQDTFDTVEVTPMNQRDEEHFAAQMQTQIPFE